MAVSLGQAAKMCSSSLLMGVLTISCVTPCEEEARFVPFESYGQISVLVVDVAGELSLPVSIALFHSLLLRNVDG